MRENRAEMSFLCGIHCSLLKKRAGILLKLKKTFPSPGQLSTGASRIERASLLRGSMTVEAAVVLPCFLFFFINLSSSLEMIRLCGNLEYALHNAGNEVCLYGSLLTDEMRDLGSTGHVSAAGNEASSGSGVSSEIGTSSEAQNIPGSYQAEAESADFSSLAGGAVLSYTYVKYRMVDSLGEDYLSSSPLSNGSSSLNFFGSSIGEQDDIVDIKLSYSVTTPVDTIGAGPLFMAGRYYGHLWNGYGISGSGSNLDQEQIVYITADSEVYHITTSCTHLRLSIRGVEYANLGNEWNRSGGRYYPCEVCSHGEAPEIVYVGAQGDRYHYSYECYTLTRQYSPVPLSEVEDSHRPCSTCGGS